MKLTSPTVAGIRSQNLAFRTALTRAEVKAETAAAIRDGDMIANGESGMTGYQLQPERYAHQRTIDGVQRLAQHSAPQTNEGVAH